MPLSRLNFATIAWRSAAVPATSVYLVSPALIAAIAACLIWAGVSKSGSPAERLMISRPSAFNARALVEMAMVWLGLMRFRRSAIKDMLGLAICREKRRDPSPVTAVLQPLCGQTRPAGRTDRLAWRVPFRHQRLPRGKNICLYTNRTAGEKRLPLISESKQDLS